MKLSDASEINRQSFLRDLLRSIEEGKRSRHEAARAWLVANRGGLCLADENGQEEETFSFTALQGIEFSLGPGLPPWSQDDMLLRLFGSRVEAGRPGLQSERRRAGSSFLRVGASSADGELAIGRLVKFFLLLDRLDKKYGSHANP